MSVRLVVERGGQPSDEQLAAITLALSAVEAQRPDRDAIDPWHRAALEEGVGGTTAIPLDLARG